MPVRMSKDWEPIGHALGRLKGQMGVFELGDANGQVIFIGYAGGKSLHGLRGEVAAKSEELDAARIVRTEVTTAYMTRYRELLMVHQADHGRLPEANPDIKLGRLSPA